MSNQIDEAFKILEITDKNITLEILKKKIS